MHLVPRPQAARATIEELTVDAVEAYVHAHLVLLETTYAHLVGPDFAAHRWAERDERIGSLGADLSEATDARAAGRPPRRSHLVARSARGSIVGVACVAQEVGAWELPHLGAAWRPPATAVNLSHLYTMPGTHGTGLGRALLEAALPAGSAAHLWVMTDNARAVAFYRRHGFTVDLGPVDAGDHWGRLPMVRMARPGPAA